MAQTFSLATSAEASPFLGGSPHIHRGILTKHTKHKTENKTKQIEMIRKATQRNATKPNKQVNNKSTMKFVFGKCIKYNWLNFASYTI